MTSTVLADRSPIADPHLGDVATRVAALDWPGLAAELDAHGCATTGALLTPEECAALPRAYGDDEPFRSRVVMARHGFGRGEYKYFAYPLPELVAALRDRALSAAAPRSPTAGTRRWASRRAIPPDHAAYLAALPRGRPGAADAAAAALRRGRLQLPAPGPLRRAASSRCRSPFLLSRPARGFHRRRVRADRAAPAHAVARRGGAAAQGEAVIFPVHHRPVQGTRGVYRVNMRHGVSRLRSGQRHTLGVIFHDGK